MSNKSKKPKFKNKWLRSTPILLIVSGLIFGFIILYYGALYADLAIKCYSYDKNPNVRTSELNKYYSAPEIMGNKPYEVAARHNGSCTDAVDRIEVTAKYKIQGVKFDELSNEVKSKLSVSELDKNQQPALCTINSAKDSSKKINFLQAGGNDIKPGSTEGIFYIIWYDIYPSSAQLGNEDKIKADCKDYNKTGNEMIDGLTIKTSFTPKR